MFKKMMVKELAKINIVSVLVSSIVGLILALNGFAYWGLAIQTLSFTVIGVVLRWHYSIWKPTFVINFRPLKEMIGFSFKLFLTNIVLQISNNVFSVILGKFYDEKQVGYYSQASKWIMLGYTTIGGMISNVAQPVFVESNGDKVRQLMIFRKMLRFGALVSFPAMFGFAFIGREFILITIGEKWLDSVPILQLLCIWGSVTYIWTLYVFLLMSLGKSDIYLYGTIGICVLQLTCIAVIFPFGILPMIGAYVACYFIGILIWHYFANRLIGIRLKHVLKDVLPYLVITAGCFFVAWFLTRNIWNIYLLFTCKIAIVAILYILIMKFSGSKMFKESISFLTNRKKEDVKSL
jgi:O-antigen/teichoic acid export membrane protein